MEILFSDFGVVSSIFSNSKMEKPHGRPKPVTTKRRSCKRRAQNLIMEIYVTATIARWRSSLVVVKPIVTVVGANHLVSESLRLWYHSRHLPGIVKVNGGGLPALRAFRGFGIFWNEMIGACLVLLFLDIIVICFRKHVANQRFVWHLFLDLVHRFLSERRKTEKVREDPVSSCGLPGKQGLSEGLGRALQSTGIFHGVWSVHAEMQNWNGHFVTYKGIQYWLPKIWNC